MQNYIIPADLLNAVGAYLLQRPMNEVEHFVMALRQCKPAPAAEAEAG